MLNPLPSVCVVVPALNEERFIGRCLESLAKVDYPAPLLEIVLADNGSTDRTIEIARPFTSRMRLRILRLPCMTVSALRNAGARQTAAERLVFLDADCVAPPEWLREAVRAAAANEGAVLGAAYLVPTEDPWVARVWQRYQARMVAGAVSFVSTHNLHVSRAAFERLGGFDESLESNEDYEFCGRARGAGHAIKLDPAIAVVHLGNPRRLRNFYARERWHGKHVLDVFLQDSRKQNNRRAVLFAAYTLLTTIGALAAMSVSLGRSDWRLASIAAAVWALAPVALSVRGASATGRWRDAPQLAVLLAVYGVARSMCLLDRGGASRRKTTKVATA